MLGGQTGTCAGDQEEVSGSSAGKKSIPSCSGVLTTEPYAARPVSVLPVVVVACRVKFRAMPSYPGAQSDDEVKILNLSANL